MTNIKLQRVAWLRFEVRWWTGMDWPWNLTRNGWSCGRVQLFWPMPRPRRVTKVLVHRMEMLVPENSLLWRMRDECAR